MDTKAFREGFRDGIPIGLGYLAVSFSLGISAKQAGLTPLQGFVTSFLENASAGEYIAFTLIGAGATYIELCLMTIIANARYLLMSCAMSQRFSPDTPMIHRFLVKEKIIACRSRRFRSNGKSCRIKSGYRHPIQDGRPMEGNCRRTGKGIRTHELRKYHCIRRRKRRHKQFPEYTGENGCTKSRCIGQVAYR